MFGIGTGELVLLLFLALIVLGPERMPKMARDVGKVMGDLRRTSDELRSEFLNADQLIRGAITVEPVIAPPGAPAPGLVDVPAAPVETSFDRELREARERLQARSAPEPETNFDRESREARERLQGGEVSAVGATALTEPGISSGQAEEAPPAHSAAPVT